MRSHALTPSHLRPHTYGLTSLPLIPHRTLAFTPHPTPTLALAMTQALVQRVLERGASTDLQRTSDGARAAALESLLTHCLA